jgi:hypothetical protein
MNAIDTDGETMLEAIPDALRNIRVLARPPEAVNPVLPLVSL